VGALEAQAQDLGGDHADVHDATISIFTAFLGDNCPSPINVPDRMRSQIKADLERGNLDPGIFKDANREILNLMQRDNYSRFKVRRASSCIRT
jgi:hypothetical protein